MRPAVDPSADADAVARFIAERGVRKVMSPEQVAQFLRDSGHDVTIVVSSNGKTYDAYSTPKLDGTECSMIEMYEVANALRNKSGLALIAMPEEPAEAAT